MQLGVFAKTFPGAAPDQVLAAARRAGYMAVQYNMACSGLGSLPESISGADSERVRTAAQAADVAIAAVSATYNMIHPDAPARDRGRRAFAAIAGAARRMGASVVTVCSGSRDPVDQWRRHPENQTPAAWNDMLAEFVRIIPIAEQNDVTIGVEPELANVVDSAATARRLLDTLQSSRVGIVIDAANLFEVEPPDRRKALIDEAIDLLGDRIVIAHAKDRGADGKFAAPGQGAIDFVHYFAALQAAGFRGTIVAHGLAQEQAAAAAEYLRRCLAQATGAPE